MKFRNEKKENLQQNGTVFFKKYDCITAKTKISFEYELREIEELKEEGIDIEKLKKVPFQIKVQYMSPKGGKFLRVISSESDTTMKKEEAFS